MKTSPSRKLGKGAASFPRAFLRLCGAPFHAELFLILISCSSTSTDDHHDAAVCGRPRHLSRNDGQASGMRPLSTLGPPPKPRNHTCCRKRKQAPCTCHLGSPQRHQIPCAPAGPDDHFSQSIFPERGPAELHLQYLCLACLQVGVVVHLAHHPSLTTTC